MASLAITGPPIRTEKPRPRVPPVPAGLLYVGGRRLSGPDQRSPREYIWSGAAEVRAEKFNLPVLYNTASVTISANWGPNSGAPFTSVPFAHALQHGLLRRTPTIKEEAA